MTELRESHGQYPRDSALGRAVEASAHHLPTYDLYRVLVLLLTAFCHPHDLTL